MIEIGPNNPKGPENAPLREYIKSFMLTVTVYDGTTDEDIKLAETNIDYGNKEHRAWLGKITYWAVSNGHVVQTQAANGK